MIPELHQVIHHIECNWSNKRLLIVGDVMLDKYIWGDVGRISPEAPVAIVHTTHQTEQPGGAANVAMNIVALGAKATIAGFIGDDDDGRLLTESLVSRGVTPAFVAVDGFPTISKTRIMGGRQQMLRLDKERVAGRSVADYNSLLDSVRALLPGSGAVVLSDYAKGTLTAEVCQGVIQAARELKIPVLVDPKSTDFERYRGATTVCPNLAELGLTLRMSTHDIEEVLAAAQHLIPALELDFLTATLSEKGIALLRRDNRFTSPAVARKVFDVSGAGDTVIAVLALCLACGLSAEVGIQLANLAAGVVVGKIGTMPVEKHELMAALSIDLSLDAGEKVIGREELGTRIAMWRANGERVAFTNGCFDLLHVGHISVLEQARRLGDRLIVGLNSDRSVSRLKGPSRPIVSERERARVLAALTAVDAVVIFDEPTPLELIVSAKPDVIVKGGDYTPESVVGAREVRSWGGEVRIIPIVEGFSTTRLIGRAAEQ